MGSAEYQLTRGDITDITDITSKGEHNIVAEAPWFIHPTDAAHWADNIIVARRRLLHWRIVGWNEVDTYLDGNHPLSGLPICYWRDGNDVTTGFSRYLIDKIHYYKGGLKRNLEVHEKGRTKSAQNLAAVQLRAEVYLGNPPKEQGEVLESMSDQVEALKSRNKLRRYPRDITDITNPNIRDVTGTIPGEIIFIRRDVTNFDVTNRPQDTTDVTNPRGVLATWVNNQWTILSTRMLVSTLPSRGLYVGQIVTLITDLTNKSAGDIYKWTGTAWTLVAGSALAHPLLDADQNNDTVAQSPTRGAIIVANSTPKWDKLLLGSLGYVPRSTGTDLAYHRAWTLVLKTADETINTDSALSADSALKFTMLANTKYSFRAVIYYTTNALADFKWRHVGPAVPTKVTIRRIHFVPAGTSPAHAVDTAYSSADVAMLAASGTEGYIEMNGMIHNGANAGDFEFHWAQNTGHASDTTVYGGSFIEWVAET